MSFRGNRDVDSWSCSEGWKDDGNGLMRTLMLLNIILVKIVCQVLEETLLVMPHYQINDIIATMWWHAGVDKCLMTVTWDCKSDREPPVLRDICVLFYCYSDLMYTLKVRCRKTNWTGTLWHEPLKSSECSNIESLEIISSTPLTHNLWLYNLIYGCKVWNKKILQRTDETFFPLWQALYKWVCV